MEVSMKDVDGLDEEDATENTHHQQEMLMNGKEGSEDPLRSPFALLRKPSLVNRIFISLSLSSLC